MVWTATNTLNCGRSVVILESFPNFYINYCSNTYRIQFWVQRVLFHANRCSRSRDVHNNRTLQSDWRPLYSPRGTKLCMLVLPDPFSIFPKGVWARDYPGVYRQWKTGKKAAPTSCQPCCGNQLHSNCTPWRKEQKIAHVNRYSTPTMAHQGACFSASS